MRQNEGEAAEHGVFYDDSNYDYMQHMRDLGTGTGDATWVDASSKQKGKGKEKQSLEDALRNSSLEDDTQSIAGSTISHYSVGGSSIAATSRITNPQRTVFEQQQDVPDELAGFQPAMDPRLREVLEALDDDEYVDDEDDIFGELAHDGQEVDRDEWEASLYDQEDEDGWESDETEKPKNEYRNVKIDESISDDLERDTTSAEPGVDEGNLIGQHHLDNPIDTSIPAPSEESQDLLATLAASKRGADNKPTLQQTKVPKASDLSSSSQLSSSSSAFPGRKKKRKGALTSGSGFSMTSSALARTETMSMLDARFDRLAEEYMDDDFDDEAGGEDDLSLASGMTGATGMSKASGFSTASRGSAWGGSQAVSEAPSLVSTDQFNSVLDDFLGNVDGSAKRRLMRKGGTQGQYVTGQGMKHLDELRSGLGPARLNSRYTQKT